MSLIRGASPDRPDEIFLGAREPLYDGVTLVPYSASDHREKVRLWLARPHVARWWGDPADALHFIDQHASDCHTVISVDGTPIGYICWQPIPPEEKAAAGLASLPEEHIDIDIFIGEPELMGSGVGTTALLLLIDHLEEQGIPSMGLAASEDNARALRAYEKAGFVPFADFVESGQRMRYLRRPRSLP